MMLGLKGIRLKRHIGRKLKIMSVFGCGCIAKTELDCNLKKLRQIFINFKFCPRMSKMAFYVSP